MMSGSNSVIELIGVVVTAMVPVGLVLWYTITTTVENKILRNNVGFITRPEFEKYTISLDGRLEKMEKNLQKLADSVRECDSATCPLKLEENRG